MTSIYAPAGSVVRQFDNMVRQMRGAKDEATKLDTATLTFHNNAKAVKADALLNDTFRGAKLVVDNRSLTADVPSVTAHGIADVLKGVKGIELNVSQARVPGGPGSVDVITYDRHLADSLRQMFNPAPAPNVTVRVI